MKSNFFPALRLTLVSIVFLSVLYPLIVLGIAWLTPGKGLGDMVTVDGKRYYTNIGQSFTDDRYFYSRPSAVDYNAAGSAGSNSTSAPCAGSTRT